jgi:uroporphyrinogen decarboxylase
MTNFMTPRERILTALNLKEPDRVPIDVGGCSTTTIIGDAYERLKNSLGVTGETIYMKRKSRSVILDEVVAQRLHTDTRAVMVGGPDDWEDIYFEDGSFKDEFGVIWRKAEGGHYNPLGNPLSNASIGEITTYQWPDPFNPGRTRGLRAIAKKLHEETDYAVVLTLPSGFVHLSTYLRGFENFLVDFAWDQKFLEALLDRTLEFFLGLTDAVMEAVDPYVDVVMYGDDVAFQNGPMVDLSRYRKIIKPRHKKIFENIKNKSRAKILYHCCGSVRTLLDDFIDMGIDALNPVQVLCTGMETSELKAEFGGRVCFWGAIDTQSVLPLGSPDDVRKEVRKRINDLAPGGGYVLASVHNIQEDVSLDNILAMVDTAFEVG